MVPDKLLSERTRIRSRGAKLVWHRAHEAVVAEDKAGEEGEVAELRGDAALEWHVGELEAGDAPPAVVARDADPRAEGRRRKPWLWSVGEPKID